MVGGEGVIRTVGDRTTIKSSLIRINNNVLCAAALCQTETYQKI